MDTAIIDMMEKRALGDWAPIHRAVRISTDELEVETSFLVVEGLCDDCLKLIAISGTCSASAIKVAINPEKDVLECKSGKLGLYCFRLL